MKRHVTLRKERAAHELRRTLIENLPVGVAIVDVETHVVEQLNPAAAAILGRTVEEICGRSCCGQFCPADVVLCSFLKPGRDAIFEDQEVVRADGTRRVIFKSVKGIEIGGRKKLLETFVDHSEQKYPTGPYRAIFEHFADAVMTVHGSTLQYTSANYACLRLFGVESESDFLSRMPWEYSPELQPNQSASKAEFSRLLNLALTDGQVAFDWIHQRLNGSSFEASVLLIQMRHGLTPKVLAIVRDVSEQRSRERRLDEERQTFQRMELESRSSQKLEAIGQLAAGIAHEINTPTQFANDSVHFLKEALTAQQTMLDKCRELKARFLAGDDAHALVEDFDQTEQALDLEYIREQGPPAVLSAIEGLSCIATIVRAMKEFSHPDAAEKYPADVNAALLATLTIAKNEYKYVAEVETHFGNLPEVHCHLGALNQVFLNLIVNAAHAIAEINGTTGTMGRICIRTQVEERFLRIDISDTGAGIPEAIRDRVFDPFFTTKEVGKGIGQGLAIARAIVCGRHGGTIVFDSETGKGTTFTVHIPILEEAS